MAIADSSRVEPHDLGAEAAPDQIRLDRDPRCRSKQNARAPDPPHSIRRLSIAAPALKSPGAHDSIVHTFVLVNLFTSPDLNPQPVPERSKRARGVRVVRARWIVSLVDMKFDRAFARCSVRRGQGPCRRIGFLAACQIPKHKRSSSALVGLAVETILLSIERQCCLTSDRDLIEVPDHILNLNRRWRIAPCWNERTGPGRR
jgi:hypothetical protein